jgi:hypothetical protein
MPRTVCYAVATLLLSQGIASLSAADYHPCQGAVVPSPPPQEPREGRVDAGYGGIVTEVTKDSITIQWVNRPGEKPRKFAVSETLAAGNVPIEGRLPAGQLRRNAMMPEYMYRLTDVKVGDCVGIFYARVNEIDTCDNIRIARRPGGLVPPLPKEAEDLRRAPTIREMFKAKSPNRPLPEWIEKLPEKKYVPYHEWANTYWAKVAPMPREVKPPGPLRDP